MSEFTLHSCILKKKKILKNAELQARNYLLLELKLKILERGKNVRVCLALSNIWANLERQATFLGLDATHIP